MASTKNKTVLREQGSISVGDKKRFSLLLVIALLAQPFLDNYYLYTDEIAAHTGGITLPPLLVVLFVFAITLVYFIKYRGGSTGKILFWYLAICAVYFVAHHLSCREFTSYIDGDFGYSMVHEAYYVVRLLTPMLLIYLTYEIGFDTGDYVNTACIMGAVCGIVLVVTNLLCMGLCSYTNEAIIGNIFKWKTILTTEDLLPKYFASKAYFSYANQISVVLTGLFPVMCYKLARSPKWYNIANVIVMTVGMLTLGTMTATIGIILEICVLAFLAVLFLIYNRKKLAAIKKNIIAAALAGVLVVGLLAGLAPISPAIRNMRMSAKNNLGNKMEHFELDMSGSEMTDDQYREYCEFVLYNYEASGIAWRYVYVYYPYEKDPAFWVAMIRNYTVGDNQNYRSLETRVIQRITQIDGSKWNKWLGISATRETNIVKIERDITAQYYSMGILGVVLFFGAYFLIILAAAVSVLKAMFKRKKFPLLQIIVAMSFCVMIVMGYYCGNSLDMTFLSTFLSVTGGVLLAMSLKPEGAEAGSFAKGLYYLNKLGAKKTMALVKETKADDRHEQTGREEALRLFPQQKNELKAALDGKNVFVFTPTVEWHYLFQRCHQMAASYGAKDNCAVVFLTNQRHYDDEKGITNVKTGVWLMNACLADKIDELTADATSVTSCVYNITTGTACLDKYRSDKLVYEYVDDLRFIVSGASDFEAYKKLHLEMLAKADLSVATAQKLYDEIKPVAKKAVLLPNAADYDFFSKTAEPNAQLKESLSGYSCVLEYYGALASWLDYAAVEATAKAHPEWAWVLVGKEIGSDLADSGILKLKNVIHIPAVPYETLPGYIACADIMTIPFVINETTLATSPVKLFEYMAAHKPIITSDLPECRRYESVVRYTSVDELEAMVKAYAAGDSKALAETLDREARENTWNARTEEIMRALGL